MLHIYRKSEKSIDNLHGVEEITDISNYDRPFLMCITSQDSEDNSAFGIIKEGARAARVRTSEELAGGFKINEMPFDFLGVKYDQDTESKFANIVDDFIYPYLKKGEDMKKQARKINFFLYCNACNIYFEIEKRLIEKLKADGIDEHDIDDIVSQIGVVAIASSIDLSKLRATCISFKDINDREVADKCVRRAAYQINNVLRGRDTVIQRISDRCDMLAYNGSGNHELREYFKDGCIVKPAICAVVSDLVERSIKTHRTNNLYPIDSRSLGKRALNFDGEFIDNDILLDKLDSSIDYGFVGRYTPEENEVLITLDQVCKKLINTLKTNVLLKDLVASLKQNRSELHNQGAPHM